MRWFPCAVALLLACTACGEPAAEPERETSPEEPALGSPQAAEDPESASSAPSPTSWPTDVEDLGTALARFESVDACLRELRERSPTLVSEALVDLGYDAFFDDACRGLDAVVRRDAAACDALSVSTARRGCRRRLALVAGDPTLCPDDLVLAGREPLCVAWAARSPDLCRAVTSSDRRLCTAVLAGDATRCPRADRARCDASIRRYASVLGDARTPHPAARAPAELHADVVRVHPPPASGGPASEDPPLALDLDQLERGVRLVADGCAHRIVLDERRSPAPLGLLAPGIRAELSLPGDLAPPFERAIGPLGASLEVAAPRIGRASATEGSFVVTALARELGGALEGRFTATAPLAPGELRIEGRFRTFVRDVDALPEQCAGGTMPSR